MYVPSAKAKDNTKALANNFGVEVVLMPGEFGLVSYSTREKQLYVLASQSLFSHSQLSHEAYAV